MGTNDHHVGRCARRVTTAAHVGALTLLAATTMMSCHGDRAPAGLIRMAVGSPPEAIDPRYATSAVAMRLAPLVFAPLMMSGEDLVPRPYLARDLQLADDQITWTVTLRADALFHDGTPVTADDVVFTFGGLDDDDVRSPHAAKFKRVTRIEKVDAHTVRFVLDKPFAAFPLELSAVGIVPAACRGRTAACRAHPIGAGAFRVARFDSSAEELDLVRFDRFVLGAPDIERIEVRVVRDSTTRLLELIDGKTDLVVGDVSPAQLDVLRAREELTVVTRPGLGYTYLAMNLRAPKPGDDEEIARTRRALSTQQVRIALAHALDVDRVITTKLRGAAGRASGMLPEGHWAKVTEAPTATDGGPPPTPPPPLAVPAYDPVRARTLLDEAGFEDRGPDAGGRFRVVLSTTNDRLRRSISVIWAHQLREVGIDVTVRVGEWATLYQDIKRGNFEMFSAQWVPVIEPDLMHWVFHTENIPAEGKAGGNRGAFVDEEVDAWLEKGRTLMHPNERAPVYQKVERRLLERLPYIPLWFEDTVAVHSRRIEKFHLRRSQAFLGLTTARLAR